MLVGCLRACVISCIFHTMLVEGARAFRPHFASHGVSKGVYFVRGDIVEGAICITTVATCVLVGGVL